VSTGSSWIRAMVQTGYSTTRPAYETGKWPTPLSISLIHSTLSSGHSSLEQHSHSSFQHLTILSYTQLIEILAEIRRAWSHSRLGMHLLNLHAMYTNTCEDRIDAPGNDWWYAMGEGTSFHRFPVSFARVVLSCCGTSIVSSHVFV
jgi:hypothetical protein